MINREKYNNAVRKYFSFLVERYNFSEIVKESQNTMLYDIEYINTNFIISISYEIMGEGVNVIIFKIIDGISSDYDDYENTVHLNRVMESNYKEEIVKHIITDKSLFGRFEKPESEIEKELLKKAVLLSSLMRTSLLKE